MIKHVEFDLFNNQGEKVVDILDLNSAHLEKTAEISDELKEAISEIKPKPDKSYILVNAMGAGEYWGANKNADFFPEKSLQEYHKTFESAGVFKHHRNKDPKQSLGKVAFSHYNKDMHRVELLLEVDKKKAPDVVQRIQDNEKVAVSMGCKVPYDICLSKDILIITKDGLKCLEDIEEGNEVLSHTGQFKKVNAISKRNIEKFIRLKVFGDYFDLESSHEHPFLVAKKDQFA
ncbi:hypothetical protein KKF61_07740, partial [Patescibacteria group bacterium]|nr:hypothetical protein [Patescibacteria group bacterium]